LVVRGDWSDAYEAFAVEKDIRELTLNGANGFTGTSLDFLKSLQFLVGLHIFVKPEIDEEPVLTLAGLRALTGSHPLQGPLDLSRLSRLERLSVWWRTGVRKCNLFPPWNEAPTC
jgi:hypothetical protein